MRSTTATLGDLQVLWGGRDRLLRVAEVAEQLAVGAWAVYKLCEDGDLPHVRINNSIRVSTGRSLGVHHRAQAGEAEKEAAAARVVLPYLTIRVR